MSISLGVNCSHNSTAPFASGAPGGEQCALCVFEVVPQGHCGEACGGRRLPGTPCKFVELTLLCVSPGQAAGHWELALAVNPLHAEGWFALGFCALKTGKHNLSPPPAVSTPTLLAWLPPGRGVY